MTPLERETYGWSRSIPDHPQRTDSPEYVRSRKQMVALAARMQVRFYGTGPCADHHGGGLWAFEGDDPNAPTFMIRNLCGIEWSAQFGAAPERVDLLRLNAQRFYWGFPQSAHALGIRALLDSPITDATGVATWVDSICNASVPLPAGCHTGTLEGAAHSAGVHHYPAPAQEIPLFAQPGLQVFVTDQQGKPVAVVPVAPRGSGNGAVEVVWAHPESALHGPLADAHHSGDRLVLPDSHPAAVAAFVGQTA